MEGGGGVTVIGLASCHRNENRQFMVLLTTGRGRVILLMVRGYFR